MNMRLNLKMSHAPKATGLSVSIVAETFGRTLTLTATGTAGATRMLDMDIMDAIQSIPGMDARPYVYIPEHRRGEFSTAGETGVFQPQWGVLEQALRMSGMEEGHILRAPAGRRVGFAGSEFVSSPDGAGYLDMRFWYDDATRTVCTNAALVPNHSALDVGSAEVPFRRGWFGTVIMGGPYAGDAEAAIAKLNATIADLQAIVSEIMDATTKPQRSPYRGAGKNLTDIVYDATINKGWLTEAAAAKLFTWPGSPTSIGPAMARLVREGRAERRKAEGKKMEWRMISASQ